LYLRRLCAGYVEGKRREGRYIPWSVFCRARVPEEVRGIPARMFLRWRTAADGSSAGVHLTGLGCLGWPPGTVLLGPGWSDG